MSFLNKLTGSLSNLPNAMAQGHVTRGYCKKCGRETRWLVHLGRGYFRCTNCQEE